MRAVDTNVLVRLATGDDEKQEIVARAFVQSGVWVSHLVLAETAWVLAETYSVGHDEIAAIIDMLINHQSVTLQDADVVVHALDQYRRRPSLGFSDCMVLEIARKAGHLPLGTFDRNLSKLDGAERL
jgi:predicted nucleic-acid-binding protein